MQFVKKSSLITGIIAASLLFCLAIGFNISPYLRGPSPYPPEWRWEYSFVNTLQRIYLPLLFIGTAVWGYYLIEKYNILKRKPLWLILFATVVLFFGLEFSILFFSRSGVGVLIHRIIDPTINGYFSAALTIHSVPEFLHSYNSVMLHFVYHAKAHPPGAILLFYYLQQLVALFPSFGAWAAQQMPANSDIRLLWEQLSASAKATVFAASIFIPVLSALSVVPLYFTANLLYGSKTALRSIVLFLFIPSLMFFIPINDAFLHIFSITAFYFFVYGLEKKKLWPLGIAGIVLFVGIFFNLSLVPPLILFFLYFLLHEKAQIAKHFFEVLKKGLAFVFGLLLPFLFLFVCCGFNFIQVTQTIMKHVPDIHSRSYTIWIFYNLYDFFIFAGLPAAIAYFAAVKTSVGNSLIKKWKKIDPLLVAFTGMLLIVNFSGSIRGETGRIWIPYVPFLVLIISGFLTNECKISTKTFTVIILLEALQLLVMQEFWVMLW
jgi:hypothetical protein